MNKISPTCHAIIRRASSDIFHSKLPILSILNCKRIRNLLCRLREETGRIAMNCSVFLSSLHRS